MMGINNLKGIVDNGGDTKNYSSGIGNILSMPLPEDLKTVGLAIVVHHGETDGNLGNSANEGKSKSEPLNEKGKLEILEISRVLKEKISKKDREKIRIHVNDDVVRNRQTAEIIEKELGIKSDQIIFSEDLRSQDRVYDENHKLIRQEYYSSFDHDGVSESIPKLRSMAADYVSKTVEENPDLIHVFVTNRVSYKGFENWADKDLNAIHDYNLNTGIMRIVPVNSNGKPLNYVDSSLPLSDQENQLKGELVGLVEQLNISDLDKFSDNVFDRDNRLRLRFLDFCKLGIQRGYTNILLLIFEKNEKLFEKSIDILLGQIDNTEQVENLNNIINLSIKDIEISDKNLGHCMSLLNILFKHENDNWKYLFRKIFSYNSKCLLENDIINNPKVSAYYETLVKLTENNKEYQKNVISIFSGDVERDRFFVPLTLIDDNGEISLDRFVEIINSNDYKTILIQGGAGSGKTVLTKYLAKQLSQSGNYWVKMIDLNNLSGVSISEIINDIPVDFDGKKVFIFDGLDEKDKIKVGKLIDIVNSNQDKNAIFICSSRFFRDKKGNDNSCLKYIIQDIDSTQSKEIIEKYTKNSDKKQKLESIIYPILQKIPDNNHSPLIITMLISIVKDYIDNDEYYEIFDKKEIKLSEIYDTFIKFLHNRENSKKKLNKERTKEENEFMSRKWDNLRIEFLKYLSLFNGGFGEQNGFYPQGEFVIDKMGERSYSKGQLRNIFYHWIDYMEYKGEELSYECVSKEDIDNDYELVYDFIDSLTNYGLLKCDEVKGYYFPHKSFQEYFAYKSLKNINAEEMKQKIINLFTSKKFPGFYGEKNLENKTYGAFYNQIKTLLLSYGFEDVEKLFDLLGELKSYIQDYCEISVMSRFNNIIEDVIIEYFSNDNDIKYKHIKLIDDTIMKNSECFIGYNRSLLSALRENFTDNETIINKLNNIENYGEDKIGDDFDNYTNVPWAYTINYIIKKQGLGSLIVNIFLDNDNMELETELYKG